MNLWPSDPEASEADTKDRKKTLSQTVFEKNRGTRHGGRLGGGARAGAPSLDPAL